MDWLIIYIHTLLALYLMLADYACNLPIHTFFETMDEVAEICHSQGVRHANILIKALLT